MECEMCGLRQATVKIRIEGTVLGVCDRCSRLGTLVEETRLPVKKARNMEIEESSIDPDFASKIKEARKNADITLEDLSKRTSVSHSVLHRIEKGMRPTDDVAKKLERALRIKLLGFSYAAEQKTSGKMQPLTLGDVAEMKIKKSQKT